MISLFDLSPDTYAPHALHDPQRAYTETDCYADLLIEVVHSAGQEPLAMLGSAVRVDFELDQWTFFKPHPADLEALYGIRVHEMQPWRGLGEQAAARIEAGQLLMPEVDAFWLPDTATTSYHCAHVKTSVAIESIDLDAETMRYFHNAGYYEVSGSDFRAVLRLDGVEEAVLPGYVDLVRFDGVAAEDPRSLARTLLAEHLTWRPASNPFERFAASLSAELPALVAGGRARFDEYAFANPRMAGAAFELLASHVRWAFGPEGEKAAVALDEIVEGTKALLFRLARARVFDAFAAIEPMAATWERAVGELESLTR